MTSPNASILYSTHLHFSKYIYLFQLEVLRIHTNIRAFTATAFAGIVGIISASPLTSSSPLVPRDSVVGDSKC